MHKWVQSKCYSYYGSNVMHLHTHTTIHYRVGVYQANFETLYKCLHSSGVLLTLCGFPLFTVSLIQSKFLWIVNHFEFLQKCFDHFMCSCFTKTKQWLLNYQQIGQTSTFLDSNKMIKQSAWPKPQSLPNHQHITQLRLFVEKFTIPYL